MSKNSGKRGKIAFLVLSVALVAAVIADFFISGEQTYSLDGFAMGTNISIQVTGRGKKGVAKDILETIQKDDKEYWSWRESESYIAKINAASGFVAVDRKVIEALSEIIPICADTDGELDLTVGQVTRAWNFDASAKTVPPEEDLNRALATVGYTNISIDNLNISLKNGAQLDLGAFGKGIACDTARSVLLKSKISGGVVSVGGSILLFGKPENKESWSVGLRNPDGGAKSYFAVAELGECAVSTSGIYEKGFYSNGIYYHHILSAKTGKPINNSLKSVTVISPSGIVSDALSTACFILGIEKSDLLLQKYKSEAVFVDTDNKVYITSGLEGKITITDGAFGYAQ